MGQKWSHPVSNLSIYPESYCLLVRFFDRIAVHGTYLNLAFISPLAGTRASFATLAMLATVDQMLWNLIPSLIQQSSQCPQLAGIISDS